jgi:hypothetical protein
MIMRTKANNNGNNNATTMANAFADAMQNNLRVKGNKRHADLTANNYATTIDRATNRRVAVAVIDSTLRGFKQNARAIYDNRHNMAVARLLAEKNLSPSLFRDHTKLRAYILQYGARYVNRDNVICHEAVALSKSTDKVALYTALGYELRYNSDQTTAKALIPATAWSVAQFVNMVAHCRKEELRAEKGATTIATADALTAQEYLRACMAQMK